MLSRPCIILNSQGIRVRRYRLPPFLIPSSRELRRAFSSYPSSAPLALEKQKGKERRKNWRGNTVRVAMKKKKKRAEKKGPSLPADPCFFYFFIFSMVFCVFIVIVFYHIFARVCVRWGIII